MWKHHSLFLLKRISMYLVSSECQQLYVSYYTPKPYLKQKNMKNVVRTNVAEIEQSMCLIRQVSLPVVI